MSIMSNDSRRRAVVIKSLETDEQNNYQQLKSLLEQLVALQEELVSGFPNKPEPKLAAKYNQLRGEINHLLGDPRFVKKVPKARNYGLWVVALYLFIGTLLWSVIAQWADHTTIEGLRWFLDGVRKLLNLATIVGLIVFVYGYYSDPGKFKAILYSRNSELRDMVQTLTKYGWKALSSLPTPTSMMTERERALGEEVLRLRIEFGRARLELEKMRAEREAIASATYSLPQERTEALLDSLKRQRATQVKNLRRLEEAKAQYGPLDVPLHIQNAIDQIQEDLRGIEADVADLESSRAETN
jgi:hypothetical protein